MKCKIVYIYICIYREREGKENISVFLDISIITEDLLIGSHGCMNRTVADVIVYPKCTLTHPSHPLLPSGDYCSKRDYHAITVLVLL